MPDESLPADLGVDIEVLGVALVNEWPKLERAALAKGILFGGRGPAAYSRG